MIQKASSLRAKPNHTTRVSQDDKNQHSMQTQPNPTQIIGRTTAQKIGRVRASLGHGSQQPAGWCVARASVSEVCCHTPATNERTH